MEQCQRSFKFVMPAGKVRFVAVHGKQLRTNIDVGDRKPIVLVHERSLENSPFSFEHVEILGPSELVVDYKRSSPHHPYSVACLKTTAALRVHCSSAPNERLFDYEGLEIKGC